MQTTGDSNIGRKINRLTAIALVEKRPNGMKVLLWECECGEYREALLGNVTSGNATQCKTCAAVQKAAKVGDSKRTHGETGTPLHDAWLRMISRVNNVYVGITCCAEWRDYLSFKRDMAEGYFEGAALDRVDNKRDYCKENCQWLTVSAHNSKTQHDRRI